MEIKEIVTYFVNEDTNILEVSFRTIDDSDDIFRTDSLDYDLVEEYGYILESDSFDFFAADSYDDEEDADNNSVELDEFELISFLNEYYTVNPTKLPKGTIY